MTEIVMLVWLGDVAHNVSFLLGLLLAGGVLVAVTILTMENIYGYDYPFRPALVWGVSVAAVISALALALIPSRDTIHLYAAARAVQIAETTELGGEVYAALLRSLREVSPAK